MLASSTSRTKITVSHPLWKLKGDERPTSKQDSRRYLQCLSEVDKLVVNPLEIDERLLEEHNITLATPQQQSKHLGRSQLMEIRLERGGAIASYTLLIGPFVVAVSMLIIDDKAASFQQYIGKGMFGTIIPIKISGKDFVAKRIHYDENLAFQLGNSFRSHHFKYVEQVVLECGFAKVCSMLGVAPKTTREIMGFDIVCYRQCAEMYMEQCDGVESLDPYEMAEATEKLRRRLSVMHSLGLVHRDIKPDNVVCSRTSNELLFCDFGETMSLAEPPGYLSHALCGGTVGFMSPAMKNLHTINKNSNSHAGGWLDLYYNDSYALEQSIKDIQKLCDRNLIASSSFRNSSGSNKKPSSNPYSDDSLLDVSTELSPASVGYWYLIPIVASIVRGSDLPSTIARSAEFNHLLPYFPELNQQAPSKIPYKLEFILLAVPINKLAIYLQKCQHELVKQMVGLIAGLNQFSFSEMTPQLRKRRLLMIKEEKSSLGEKQRRQNQLQNLQSKALTESLSDSDKRNRWELTAHMLEHYLSSADSIDEAVRLLTVLNSSQTADLDSDTRRSLTIIVACLEGRSIQSDELRWMAGKFDSILNLLVMNTYFYGSAKEALRIILDCDKIDLLLTVVVLVNYLEHFPDETERLETLLKKDNLNRRQFFQLAAVLSVSNPQKCLELHRQYHGLSDFSTENVLSFILNSALVRLHENQRAWVYYKIFLQSLHEEKRPRSIVNRFLSVKYKPIKAETQQEISECGQSSCATLMPNEVNDLLMNAEQLTRLIAKREELHQTHEVMGSLLRLYCEKIQVHLRVIHRPISTSIQHHQRQCMREIYNKSMEIFTKHHSLYAVNGLLLIHLAEWLRIDGQIARSEQTLQTALKCMNSHRCCQSHRVLEIYLQYFMYYQQHNNLEARQKILEKIVNMELSQSFGARNSHVRRTTLAVILMNKLKATERAESYFQQMLPTLKLKSADAKTISLCTEDLTSQRLFFFAAELARISGNTAAPVVLLMGINYFKANMAAKCVEVLRQVPLNDLKQQQQAECSFYLFKAYERLGDLQLAPRYGEAAFQLYCQMRDEALRDCISKLNRNEQLKEVYTCCSVLVPLAMQLNHIQRKSGKFKSNYGKFQNAQYRLTKALLKRLHPSSRTKQYDELLLKCTLEIGTFRQKMVALEKFIKAHTLQAVWKLVGEKKLQWLREILKRRQPVKLEITSNDSMEINTQESLNSQQSIVEIIKAKRIRYASAVASRVSSAASS